MFKNIYKAVSGFTIIKKKAESSGFWNWQGSFMFIINLCDQPTWNCSATFLICCIVCACKCKCKGIYAHTCISVQIFMEQNKCTSACVSVGLSLWSLLPEQVNLFFFVSLFFCFVFFYKSIFIFLFLFYFIF